MSSGIPNAGAFSARNSNVGSSNVNRSKTPPTGGTHLLRRTGSNASSSAQTGTSTASRTKTPTQLLGRSNVLPRSSARGGNQNPNDTSIHSSASNFGGGSAYRENSTTSFQDESNADARSSASRGGASRSTHHHQPSQHPYQGQFGGLPAYKRSNMAPRVYLPGEEEVVMNSRVVDVSLAAADIELLENDLGRSSLMMPKSVRQKMLTMRKDLFPDIRDDENHQENNGDGGNSSKKRERDPFFGAGSAGVSADPVSAPDQPAPLPRGSQLLRRLQASADRSMQLLEELEKRSSSCNSILNHILLTGGIAGSKSSKGASASPSAVTARLSVDPTLAALNRRTSAESSRRGSGAMVSSSSPIVLTPSPSPRGGGQNKHQHQQQQQQQTPIVLTPSPGERNHRRQEFEQQQNLDDTFANLTPLDQQKQPNDDDFDLGETLRGVAACSESPPPPKRIRTQNALL